MADLHSGVTGGNEGDGDAAPFDLAEQVLRIVHLEGQPEHGSHWRQCDVALVPGNRQAETLPALEFAHAHNAGIGHCASVAARLWAGQGEAGDVLAAGQTRQVVLALLFGTVLHQQFGRAQRIGHHGGHGRAGAARGDLRDDGGMCQCREAEPAILFRDDHAEELLVLQVLPGGGLQILVDVHDVPVVDHPAERLCLIRQKGLFGRAEGGHGQGQPLLPVRGPLEQVGFPPGVARFQGLLLGIAHGRQDALEELENRTRESVATDIVLQIEIHHRDQRQPQQPGETAEPGHGQQRDGHAGQDGAHPRTTIGQRPDDEKEYKRLQKCGHGHGSWRLARGRCGARQRGAAQGQQ